MSKKIRRTAILAILAFTMSGYAVASQKNLAQAQPCSANELNEQYRSVVYMVRGTETHELPTVTMNELPSDCATSSIRYVGNPTTGGFWASPKDYERMALELEAAMLDADKAGWTFATTKTN